jgi:gamma-glutamylcyclotransferase (GGCT)/AIG2-like uncharacterized protein YtfP
MKLLVYGTLRTYHRNHQYLGLDEACDVVGEVKVPGFSMYDHAWFPCAVEDPKGEIVGELLNVHDHSIWRHLDQYEGYNQYAQDDSLFVRRTYEFADIGNAYMYIYHKPLPTNAVKIEGGDWKAYVERSEKQRAGRSIALLAR